MQTLQLSDNIKFVILLKLGLNTGKGSNDWGSITVTSFQKNKPHNHYKIGLIHSVQDKNDVYKMVHTEHTIYV